MEENYEAGMVTENLEEVEEKIQAACNRSGRKAGRGDSHCRK